MKFWMNAILIAATTSLAWGTSAASEEIHDSVCGPKAAQIMILGTYHFANPGLDSNDPRADDVLSPMRQAQIEEVVQRLAAFKPTKIMVEAPYRDPYVAQASARYLTGQHQLTRNEVEQLGFRLAKAAGLSAVTPIDFEMRMNGLRPDELDDDWRPKASAPSAGSPSKVAPAAPPPPTEEEKLLYRSTIRENLLRLNDPAHAETEHSQYLRLLLPDDSTPALYAHSDLLTNWYKRNFRMFANIARETHFPGDRVLVIVGSGHLKIFQELALDADYYCLVDARAYLR